MVLTSAQLTVIKNDIAANSDLNTQPNTPDGNNEIARLYNLDAAPDYWVWRTKVAINEVGQTFNATELAGLTQLNTSRLQNLAAWLMTGVNPSVADVRQFFDDIFSGAGGTNTRPALLVLWRRKATRLEKLFATGAGTTAAPSTMSVEGAIAGNDIQAARQS